MSLPSVLTSSRLICAAGLALTLAACGSTGEDLSAVRTGPQAVHPGSMAPRQVNRPAPQTALGETLFQEFCTRYPTAAASEAAVRASGRFEAPEVTRIGPARFAIYKLRSTTENASVALATNSVAGLQCSTGDTRVSRALYEDGRITRQ